MDKVLSTYFKKGIYQKNKIPCIDSKVQYWQLWKGDKILSYNVTAFFEFYSEIQNHFGKMALVDKHHET